MKVCWFYCQSNLGSLYCTVVNSIAITYGTNYVLCKLVVIHNYLISFYLHGNNSEYWRDAAFNIWIVLYITFDLYGPFCYLESTQADGGFASVFSLPHLWKGNTSGPTFLSQCTLGDSCEEAWGPINARSMKAGLPLRQKHQFFNYFFLWSLLIACIANLVLCCRAYISEVSCSRTITWSRGEVFLFSWCQMSKETCS